jgi:NAD(P)-dependent dehydrogenase (short-subunit alcohol dehydrogenase family)
MSTTDSALALQGDVVVLTGGGGILGQRLAAALVACGASVAVLDRSLEKAVESAKNCGDPTRTRGYEADITSRGQLEDVKRRIESDLGSVSVLVNAAATKSENFFAPFEKFPLEDWHAVMEVNLTGAMLCCQVFGHTMAERGAGSIVNVLSVYGIVAPDQRIYEGSMYEGHPINSPAVYSASKAGLLGLTKYLSAYWGHRNVRVNAVTPGGVFSGQNEVFVRKYSARVPLGRMADRDEISGAVVFLASSASSYVTGQNLVVDGGLTVW